MQCGFCKSSDTEDFRRVDLTKVTCAECEAITWYMKDTQIDVCPPGIVREINRQVADDIFDEFGPIK